MFVCSIPAAAIATFLALLMALRIGSRDPGADNAWHVLAHLISPGFYMADFYQTHAAYKGMDFTPLVINIGTDFVFYFCLVFGLAIWADRKWRRRQAERIIPDEAS